MNKLSFLTILFITLLTPIKTFAFTGEGFVGCVGECTTCHNLSKDEAAKFLKTEQFNASIKSIEMSPVKGLWQVNMTQDGKPVKVYIDFAKEFLIQANFAPLESIGEPKQLKVIDRSKIPLYDAILMGSPDAEHKIIVFDDPDCPYCAKFHDEIKKILKTRDDIAFYILMFPLPSHKDAYRKSLSIVCDGTVKYLDMAFNKEDIPNPTCTSKAVDKTLVLGGSLGIGSTPSIILPDGRLLAGYVEGEVLINIMKTGKQADTDTKPQTSPK